MELIKLLIIVVADKMVKKSISVLDSCKMFHPDTIPVVVVRLRIASLKFYIY